MDDSRFDGLVRLFGAEMGRRGLLRSLTTVAAGLVSWRAGAAGAQTECAEPCGRNEVCIDGRCVKSCTEDRQCRNRRGDPCLGGRCEAGICVEFIVDCAPGYACCGNGECCPAPCATPSECVTGDPCIVGTCGVDGVCQFARREPCLPCASDAECAAGDLCCQGVCVGACPEGMVFGVGCACTLPPGVADASDIVVVDTANGNTNVGGTSAPGTITTGGGVEISGNADVEILDTPPSVVTVES